MKIDKKKNHTKAGATRKQVKCILCGTNYSASIDMNIPYFIQHAMETYEKKFNEKLVFGGKEAKMVETLLRTIDLDRLKAYWSWFINYKGDDWKIKGSTKDLKGFLSNVNRIAQQVAPALVKAKANKNSGSQPASQTEGNCTTADAIRQAKDDMFEYLNSVLDPESQEYDHWADKLQACKTLEDITYWDNAFQQWRPIKKLTKSTKNRSSLFILLYISLKSPIVFIGICYG
jgi:hypothetical protein